MNLISEIKNLKNQPLEASVFEKLGIPLILWNDLKTKSSIEEICPCVLYMPIDTRYSGHYVFLNIRNGILQYFDSYGYSPTRGLGYSIYIRQTPEPDENYLMNLINRYLQNGGRISINPYNYQKENDFNLSTCGRWCVCRFLKQDLSHEEFKTWFQDRGTLKDISNDTLITMLTFII